MWPILRDASFARSSGDRLRLGLGLYHAEIEMPEIAARIAAALGPS